jgi:hypothetical protein
MNSARLATSAEYLFTQLNQLPVPYSLPDAAVLGQT